MFRNGIGNICPKNFWASKWNLNCRIRFPTVLQFFYTSKVQIDRLVLSDGFSMNGTIFLMYLLIKFRLMKKIILLAAVFTLFASKNFAQVETALGVKAGIGISNFRSSDLSERQVGTGPSIGGYANLSLAKIVQFQVEALYSGVSGEYTYDGTEYESRMAFLEFPISMKIRLPLGDNLFPYVYVGESAGFKLNENTDVMNSTNSQADSGDQFDNVDLATIVGGGVDLETENIIFSFDMRYGFGMIDIMENDAAARSRRFSFTVGLGFRLDGDGNNDTDVDVDVDTNNDDD